MREEQERRREKEELRKTQEEIVSSDIVEVENCPVPETLSQVGS